MDTQTVRTRPSDLGTNEMTHVRRRTAEDIRAGSITIDGGTSRS